MSRQTAIQTTSANQIQVDAAQSPQRNTAASPWSYMPAMDVVEHQHEFTIDFDAPGIARDQIDLAYDNGELSLHGVVPPRWPESVKPLRQEYGVGDFDRSIPLGLSIVARAARRRSARLAHRRTNQHATGLEPCVTAAKHLAWFDHDSHR